MIPGPIETRTGGPGSRIAVGQPGMNRQVGRFAEPQGLEVAQHRGRVGESVVRALGQGPLDGPCDPFADARDSASASDGG